MSLVDAAKLKTIQINFNLIFIHLQNIINIHTGTVLTYFDLQLFDWDCAQTVA